MFRWGIPCFWLDWTIYSQREKTSEKKGRRGAEESKRNRWGKGDCQKARPRLGFSEGGREQMRHSPRLNRRDLSRALPGPARQVPINNLLEQSRKMFIARLFIGAPWTRRNIPLVLMMTEARPVWTNSFLHSNRAFYLDVTFFRVTVLMSCLRCCGRGVVRVTCLSTRFWVIKYWVRRC